MMPAAGSYRISTDAQRKLLVIRFTGFLTPASLRDYDDEKNAAIARLACGPNDHITLCDFTDCGPQSQEVLKLFAASLADPRHMSRRIAAVVLTALARMQVQRVVKRPGFACFNECSAALAWLMAERTEAVSHPSIST